MMATPIEDEVLEPIEVDNRPTSVVVSVRLESDLARELTAVARSRGLRLSDVLREAAKNFAARPGWTEQINYEVQGPLHVTFGAPAWRSNRTPIQVSEPVTELVGPWRSQVSTK